MKKVIVMFLAGVMLLSLLACASQPTQQDPTTTTTRGEDPPPEVPRDPVTLRMAWWGGQARHDLYNKILDLYEELNDHVTIDRDFAGWGDYWTKKATQAAGGNLPDMTKTVFDRLSEFAKRGSYEPLDQYVNAGIIQVGNWAPIVVDAGKVDGVLYSLASGVTANAVMVNEDLIRRAGMEPPPFEISYADFAAYVRELQEKLPDGVWATMNPTLGTHEHFQTWILQKGYQITNEEGTELGFPKEVVIEFLEYWMALYNDGVVLPIEIQSEPLGDGWADSHFARGTIAINFANSNQLKIFQRYTEDNLILIRNPVMPDGANRTGEYLRPSSLAIASNSRHKEEVARFINWFVHDEEATRIFNAELGVVGPAHIQEMLLPNLDPKDVLVFDHFNRIVQDIPFKMPDPEGTASITAAFARAAESVVYGTSTIEEAVDAFFAEVADFLR